MKHSLELALLLSALAVFSCKNDDDAADDGSAGTAGPLQRGEIASIARAAPRSARR
jgi:hypothetical protein